MLIWADGFDHYGDSTVSRDNMLSGAWAAIATTGLGGTGLSAPPWGARTGSYAMPLSSFDSGNRRILGAAKDTLFLSMGFSIPELPGAVKRCIVSFKDGSNDPIAALVLLTTGAIDLRVGGGSGGLTGTVAATTQSPVITNQTWHHMEMKIVRHASAGTFELRVDGTTVINVTGLALGGVSIEQLEFGYESGNATGLETFWYDDTIVFDDTGSYNNNFAGDLRVASLFPNGDTTTAGWTPRPREKIGTGILDNTAIDYYPACVTTPAATEMNLSNGDYTLEQFVRFTALPTGTNYAQITGRWDENANKRCYQLYLGGPDLDNGYLTFRTSTDGQAGTVEKVISYPWTPDLGRWYHVAIVRASGETLLFIDGIQQGLAQADVRTYFAGTTQLAIGASAATHALLGTHFDGYMDEIRMTVGYARYTANFTPTTVPFGRNITDDPHFDKVVLLAGFDNGFIDDSTYARALTANQGAVTAAPDDKPGAFKTIYQHTPRDDTYVEAALIAATDIYTQTALPTNGETVTVGEYGSGPTSAVYKFVTVLASAFDVLIGADVESTIANLSAAINKGAGEGTVYGTGTEVNIDVVSSTLPDGQMLVTALTPGTGGNSLAVSTTAADGSWDTATLTGGQDIPGPSEFTFDRPPPQTTVIKGLVMVTRSFKSDSGTATMQVSYVAPQGGVAAGADNALTLNPTYRQDVFEEDPDTSSALTPASLIGARIKLNRTT